MVHYPRIRIIRDEALVLREGVTLTFFMPHSHGSISGQVQGALEAYLREVGPDALMVYADEEGVPQPLDTDGWALVQQALRHPDGAMVHLSGEADGRHSHRFIYRGRDLGSPAFKALPGVASALSFWLPTEHLEEYGPERMCGFALDLASRLPFSSGACGLAFHCDTGWVEVDRALGPLRSRHPGMDVTPLDWISLHIGTRIRGPSWLTFLGPPVLGALGGVAGLRARLRSSGTTLQELPAGRAVVRLGEWPEAGDTEQGQALPAYRELARVLEPWRIPDEVS